jgi:hypothetical protein
MSRWRGVMAKSGCEESGNELKTTMIFFVLDPDLERTVTLCLKKMREGAIM